MFGKSFFQSSVIVTVWIYGVFAAPSTEEENSMMEKNMSNSCFKDTLPQQLQLHYDMCMGNNLSGDNMMKESEILSCILKTEGVISDEEAMDVSKLKMPATEEEALDMKVIEEATPFIMSVEKCEANEDVKKAEDFVQCLYETLSMNCTNAMASNGEESAAQEAPEAS